MMLQLLGGQDLSSCEAQFKADLSSITSFTKKVYYYFAVAAIKSQSAALSDAPKRERLNNPPNGNVTIFAPLYKRRAYTHKS